MHIYAPGATVPFTYLIRFRPTGQVYYGVRYKTGTNPDDLWTKYFSSSKVVKQLIKEHGASAFDVEIRRTFNTAEEAVRWEFRVLSRIKPWRYPEVWLNRGMAHAPEKIISNRRGVKISQETRDKQSAARVGKVPWNKGITYDNCNENALANIRKAAKSRVGKYKGIPSWNSGKPIPSKMKDSISSGVSNYHKSLAAPLLYISKIIGDEIIVKRVLKTDVVSWQDDGWFIGRKGKPKEKYVRSAATIERARIYEKEKREKNRKPRQPLAAETRAKISAANKARPQLSMLGKKHKPETIAKMKAKRALQVITDEARANMRLAQQARHRKLDATSRLEIEPCED